MPAVLYAPDLVDNVKNDLLMTADNIQRLRTLIDRYYSALTTPAEEREMRDLLNDPSLPAEYLPGRKMMVHLHAVAVPDGY